MKNQRGFTLIELVLVLFFVLGPSLWVWNAVKLASCDFNADYRCEVIHGVGLVLPPTSVVTVWFSDDGV